MSRSVDKRGFTLIEILIVIAILGLLLGLVAVNTSKFFSAGAKSQTQAKVRTLELFAEKHESNTGAFPPSSLASLAKPLKTDNDVNEGIEAFVACFIATDYRGDRPDEADLQNTDNDEANGDFSIFENRDLFEFVDANGSPFLYIHNADYGKTFTVSVVDKATGDVDFRSVEAYKSKKTGTYSNLTTYQIWSPGQDLEFGTEDDVANFEIEWEEGE